MPSKPRPSPESRDSPGVPARQREGPLWKGVLHRASRDARPVEGPLLLSFGLPSVRDEIEKDYDNNQNETCREAQLIDGDAEKTSDKQ